MITTVNGFIATQEFKNQYNELMMHVFGFSFDKWHDRNIWDDSYACYSIIEDGVMIANVSVSKMKLLINGLLREYLQFGAVATRREYRGKGLSRKIMEYVFNLYSNTPSFLFANDSVQTFYPKFGFIPVTDRQPYIEYKLKATRKMIRLDIADPKVDQYLKERNQFSKVFDCINQYGINWFHLLYGFNHDIYEIPQLGAMMIAKQQGNTLFIYDLIIKKSMSFMELIPHLHFTGVEMIKFGFNPDWLGVNYQTMEYKMEDSTLFVKGNFQVPAEYILPICIRT
jgi:GNAT superfamily N-acetyltransferase